MLQLTNEDNPVFDFTETFSQMANISASASYDFNGIKYSSLFPKCMKKYYAYYGSLSSPPCLETCIWIIFKGLVPISYNQVDVPKKNLLINEFFKS